MNSFDLRGFHLLNNMAGHHPHFLDPFMEFIAQDALEIYAVLFIVAWFALPRKEEAKRHALVMAGLGGILALLCNVVISHVWVRSRPFVTLHQGQYTELIPHSNDASFPSDHTSGSFGFASGTWGRSAAWIQWVFTIVGFIVMIARVYCGVHWPTDVIGGMIVGIIAGRVVWIFSKWVQPLTNVGLRIFRYGRYARGGRHARQER